MIIVIKRGVFFLALGLLFLILAMTFFNKTSTAESFCHENTRSIIIDAGHGLPDGGAVGKNGVTESPINLKIALNLSDELTERGFNVIMTRSGEEGLDKKKKADMQKRLEIMREGTADIFVSIHINKFHQSKYRGAEVLYSPNFIQSTLLSQLIMDKIKEIDPENQSRTIKEADSTLFLMKHAPIPAVIVECGFISNPDEEKLLQSDTYQSRLASAICDGIVSYYDNISDFEKINIIKSEEFVS